MSLDVRPPAWGHDELIVPPALKVEGLGSPHRVWLSQGSTAVVAAVLAIIGLVLAAAGIGVFIGTAVLAPGLILLGVGGFLSFLGIYNLVDLLGAARAIVEYEGGFAVLVGSKVGTWTWDAVAQIWTDESLVSGKRGSYHVHRYAVSRANGETLRLLGERFVEMPAIIASFKARVGPLLLPPLQKAYDAGETLAFGTVRVDRDAIAVGGHRIAWAAVGKVEVKNGRLIVTPRDGSAPIKMRASKIPNIEQLGALIGVDPRAMELTYY